MGKIQWVIGLVLMTLLVIGCQGKEQPLAQTPIPTPTKTGAVLTEVPGYGQLSISEPHTYKNMTLFVISKTAIEAEPPEDFITLDEGLAQKQVIVSEKEEAEVRTLQVENTSDKPLFIRVGEILKGGKQDRTITASLIIPPKSGKVDVPSLCVEQSRWTGGRIFVGRDQASGESISYYINISNDGNSNAMRIAIVNELQDEVWMAVEGYNQKVEKMTGDRLQTSSFNEAMDNKKMQEVYQEYGKAFDKLLGQYPQAIGVTYALNGEIQTVELFQTNGLLQKAYPKFLKAYASESAVNPVEGEIKTVTNGEVKDFIARMEKGEIKKEAIEGNQIIRLENDGGITSEVKDKSERVMHRQYLAK